MLSQASQAHGLPQASHRPDQRLTGTTSRGQRRLLGVRRPTVTPIRHEGLSR